MARFIFNAFVFFFCYTCLIFHANPSFDIVVKKKMLVQLMPSCVCLLWPVIKRSFDC